MRESLSPTNSILAGHAVRFIQSYGYSIDSCEYIRSHNLPKQSCGTWFNNTPRHTHTGMIPLRQLHYVSHSRWCPMKWQYSTAMTNVSEYFFNRLRSSVSSSTGKQWCALLQLANICVSFSNSWVAFQWLYWCTFYTIAKTFWFTWMHMYSKSSQNSLVWHDSYGQITHIWWWVIRAKAIALC